MEQAIRAFEKNLKPNFTRLVTDVLNATGTEAAKTLKTQLLKAAAFDPDQPRGKDGKWEAGGGEGGGETGDAPGHFYHGTTADRVQSILKNGIDTEQGATYSETKAGHTYLASTEHEATYWARETAALKDPKASTRKVAILKVRIPESEFKKISTDENVAKSQGSVKFKGKIKPEWIESAKVGELSQYASFGDIKWKKVKVKALASDKDVTCWVVVVLNDEGEKIRAAVLRSLAPKIKGFSFDKSNPKAVQWVADHATETIDGLSDTTREDIKTLVERSMQGDFDVDTLTDEIAELIGDSDRAEMIARTETMRASNVGQQQAWDQAVEGGLLTGDEQQEWIVTPDDRLCPECEPFDEVVADLGGTFTADGTTSDGPPLHPRCRCTLGLKLD